MTLGNEDRKLGAVEGDNRHEALENSAPKLKLAVR
jgi:hypothetical protein